MKKTDRQRRLFNALSKVHETMDALDRRTVSFQETSRRGEVEMVVHR